MDPLFYYVPIIVMIGLTVALTAVMFVLTYILGPKSKETLERFRAPYESGIQTSGMSTKQRYPIKFALLAILFVIFDVEIIFFYPWAATYNNYRASNLLPATEQALGFWLVEMLVFFAILLVGYLYVVNKGVFEWD